MFREFREDVMGVLDKHEIKESNITSRDDIRYKGERNVHEIDDLSPAIVRDFTDQQMMEMSIMQITK